VLDFSKNVPCQIVNRMRSAVTDINSGYLVDKGAGFSTQNLNYWAVYATRGARRGGDYCGKREREISWRDDNAVPPPSLRMATRLAHVYLINGAPNHQASGSSLRFSSFIRQASSIACFVHSSWSSSRNARRMVLVVDSPDASSIFLSCSSGRKSTTSGIATLQFYRSPLIPVGRVAPSVE